MLSAKAPKIYIISTAIQYNAEPSSSIVCVACLLASQLGHLFRIARRDGDGEASGEKQDTSSVQWLGKEAR